MIKSKAKTVDELLKELKPEQSAFIQMYLAKIKALVPEAKETIKFSTPSLTYMGKAFAGIAPLKEKYSFYPYSSHVLLFFKEELKAFEYSSRAIHFSPEKPIPDELLRRMVFERIMEIEKEVSP
jgi:uncharacterized protein YdhG (YjbR/CyaY superfamily)